MKIDVTNYFFVSEGVFSAQPKGWVEKARASTKSTAPLHLGNRVWRPITKTGRRIDGADPETGRDIWVPVLVHPEDAAWQDAEIDASCRSFYWVSEDGTHLMRLSNHWSSGKGQVGAHFCGSIRSCWWALATKGRTYRKGVWHLGIIAFSDMR